ncbi:hypothetical protein GO491_01670 [Flavobacteriaceae bacterium Ap0902]|nr:hypothetical protein [Flavobacteriaceae bacterium Ap0902]
MRILFCFIFFSFYACGVLNSNTVTDKNELKFEETEDGEYDIIVLDGQYDYFLNAIAFPENFYSESYYKNKNIFLVNEWNYRHTQPMRYDPNLYEVSIDYSPHIDYGKTFEYKLYNFFKFIEWKYGVDLDGRPR